MQKLELKKLQALLSEHSKATAEFKRLEALRDSAVSQENRLIQDGDLESAADVKKLGDLRTQIDLAPVKLGRAEAHAQRIDAQIKAETRAQCLIAQTLLLERFDATKAAAETALKPFVNGEHTHFAYKIEPALPVLIHLRERIDTYGMIGVEREATGLGAAQSFLQCAKQDFTPTE
jgi:hypothetical protein